MSRNTVKQGGLSTTIKQGIQMLQGKDIPNYTLIFIDPTADRRSGEEQTIWNPYISLGRGSSATIKYSDQFPTVSRNHAYIMIEGGKVFIEPDMAATNATLVNHNQVRRKTELFPGDEIQLSLEGPKLRFISTPANRTTASMKFTQRLQQFGSQALRPYKTALSVMSVLLIGLASYLIWFSISTKSKIDSQASQISIQDMKINETSASNQNLRDSLLLMEKKFSTIGDKNSLEAYNLRNRISDLSSKIQVSNVAGSTAESSSIATTERGSTGIAGELKKFEKSVYFIIIKSVLVYHPDKNDALGPFELSESLKYRWSGTGFMTSDGEFITARHVIEPWRFDVQCGGEESDNLESQVQTFLNNAELKGGNVEVTYLAISPTGDDFTFTNKSVLMDDSKDKIKCNENTTKQWLVKQCGINNLHTDWAKVIMGNRPGEFKINRNKSLKLEKGTSLYGLGYSHGGLMQSFDPEKFDLDPVYLSGTVVQQNTVNGMINISSNGIATGSSGGPILVKNSNGWEVVGIISHGYVDGLKQLVPIWQVR